MKMKNYIYVTREQLIEAMTKVINELEDDSLADLAEWALGGYITLPTAKKYSDMFKVEKTESYSGAFNELEKKGK